MTNIEREKEKNFEKKLLAIYVQGDDGNYDQSDSSTFPTEGYELNTSKSICSNEGTLTQSMIKTSTTRTLTKNIFDSSFREIIRQVEYKSKLKGKYFYQVDAYYPSSQICSHCGHRDESYRDLRKRVYECIECKNTMDRDLNASINIAFEGVTKYMRDVYD